MKRDVATRKELDSSVVSSGAQWALDEELTSVAPFTRKIMNNMHNTPHFEMTPTIPGVASRKQKQSGALWKRIFVEANKKRSSEHTLRTREYNDQEPVRKTRMLSQVFCWRWAEALERQETGWREGIAHSSPVHRWHRSCRHGGRWWSLCVGMSWHTGWSSGGGRSLLLPRDGGWIGVEIWLSWFLVKHTWSWKKSVAKENYQLSQSLEPQEVDSLVQTPRRNDEAVDTPKLVQFFKSKLLAFLTSTESKFRSHPHQETVQNSGLLFPKA